VLINDFALKTGLDKDNDISVFYGIWLDTAYPYVESDFAYIVLILKIVEYAGPCFFYGFHQKNSLT
jgi:hypothetical protein